MNYTKATLESANSIFELVQRTIKTIYPKYYPMEVVTFFCQLHNKEHIEADIEAGLVYTLCDQEEIVGTGSFKDNHITRVYVKPEVQGQGYGSYIMQQLEREIYKSHDTVTLDASLPACRIYEHRGYHTLKHETWNVENDVVLVYEVMLKDNNQ